MTEAVRSAWSRTRTSSMSVSSEGSPVTAEALRGVAPVVYVWSAPCLVSSGGGPGDEVIVPDSTWIASVAPVSYVGAVPVFADIDAQSWCVSPEFLEALITPRTKAAIVVDLYGSMPDWDRLARSSTARDSADRGRGRSGRLALARETGRGVRELSAFSFHGSKTLTTGEGGMLVMDDDRLLDRVMRLRDHGRRPGDVMFRNEEIGFKYKMSAMQAALGAAQLERLSELIDLKRRIFNWYAEELEGWEDGTLNPDVPGLFNSYWMTTVIVRPELGVRKEAVIPELKREGIDARPFFYPLSGLPAYAETAQAEEARARNVASGRITPYGINLPSALILERHHVQFVCRRLRDCVSALRGDRGRVLLELLWREALLAPANRAWAIMS